MKIKPLHIYLFIAVAAIIFLVIISQSGINENSGEISTNFPDDEMHRNLGKEPGKGNVNTDVIKEMERLKAEVDSNPGDTAKVREYADFLAAAHRSDEALEYYKKIIDKDPKRSDIILSMGFVYYSQEEYLMAEELMERLLKIDPKNHEALYNLGAIAATKGEKNKAKEYWERVVREHPNSTSAEMAKSSLNRL
jgi:tetratricopeptide (TPR) repeat protein